MSFKAHQTTDNPTAGPGRTDHNSHGVKICWWCEGRIRKEPKTSEAAIFCSARCRDSWDDTKAFLKRMEKRNGSTRKQLTRSKEGEYNRMKRRNE